MRIHEDVEVVLLCLAEHGNGMVYPCLIVLARPCMLYSLPRKDVPDGVVSPTSQPCKVCAGILEREGTIDEGDIVTIEEILGNMRRLVWGRGEFGIGGGVYAMEGDLGLN